MKKYLLIILLFVGNVLLAQDPEILLLVNTGNDNTNKKLGGVNIEIFQDGKKIQTIVSPSNGKVPPIYVPIGHVYLIKFKKQGFVTIDKKESTIAGRFLSVMNIDLEL